MTTKIDLEELTLKAGGHRSPEEGMCVTEAVAYMAGEKHSDQPQCLSPAIGAFMRSWNDSLPDDDRQRLKPWIPKVIGTATGPEDEDRRAWLATDWLVRTFTPAWLDKAGLTEHAQKLRDLHELTSSELATAAQPIIEAARKDSAAAWAAAGAAAWDAARDAAWAAARDAAWDAAWAAAGAAAWDAAKPHTTYSAQYDAAYKAAKPLIDDAFADTVTTLQESAFELLERMIAVGKIEEAAAA